MTPKTVLALALVALSALVAVPSAGAAVWQGPLPISDAGTLAHDTPAIALGPAGDAAAGWWDNAEGGRIVITRRRAGGTWSTPVRVGLGADSIHVYLGVDGAGNVTATWSTGNGGPMAPSVTNIATWLAGSATPTVEVLNTALLDTPEPVYVNDIAVSAAGQAVLAGTAGNFDMVLGYRATPTGAWAYNQKMGVAGGPGQPLLDPHVAINETGNAVASYHTTATIFASRRNAFSDWGAVETVAAAGSSESRSVAIDAAGNTYVAFAVGSGGSVSAGAAFRPVGGDWAVQYPLSPQGSTFVAREVTIAIDRAGGAYMSWMQTGPAPADSSINGRSLANGAWGTIERISEMGADFPRTVMTNDGTVLTVWQHDTGADPRSSFARMRSPAGAWGDLRPLSGEYSGYADPHPATDGRHLTVVAAPLVGAVKQVLLSVFDPVAPVVAPIAVSASTTVGGATTLSVTATDEWSAIPTVAWAFGDGATGTGLSTSHAYASAGAYTATVTVTDAAGNATARTIALTIAAAQSTLTTAKFSGKWTASRIKGTLLIKGTAPLAGTYAVDVFSGKTRKLHSAFTPPAGAFAKTIKLPPKLLPGSYRVALTPSFPASQVTPASRTSKLAAPIEGVVSTITLSGTNGGPAARTLRGASTIWVSFRFAAVSRGSLKLTWYRRVKGKRSALGSTTKSPGRKVGSYLRLGGTLLGTFTAVLTRKGKVIAQGSIRAL